MVHLTDKVIQLLLGCVLFEKKCREKTAPGADLLYVLSPGGEEWFSHTFSESVLVCSLCPSPHFEQPPPPPVEVMKPAS